MKKQIKIIFAITALAASTFGLDAATRGRRVRRAPVAQRTVAPAPFQEAAPQMMQNQMDAFRAIEPQTKKTSLMQKIKNNPVKSFLIALLGGSALAYAGTGAVQALWNKVFSKA
jgi:hypothetical protein